MNEYELMIGNYVLYKESPSSECQIVSIKKLSAEDISYFLPIPITIDWLIDLGFEGCNNEFTDGFETFEFWDEGLFWTGGEGRRLSNIIKYVHELQNIYFLMSGTQLKLTCV